jgi:haloalkane dehalogenase
MIPPLLNAGCRVVVPDLVGFGRSDKPARARDHSYAHQVAWMSAWMAQLDLRNVTLFCQDWGSLIGLRMVAHMPERFARVALANGGLPTGDMPVPAAFHWWRRFARYSPWFPIGRIVSFGCVAPLSAAETAAYDAPFPSRAHQTAARAYPSFVPISPADPECAANTQAWGMLRHWQKPFITLFSTRDPVTRGGDRMFQEAVPGAQGQAHTRVRTAGHFLQEDKGPELAQLLWQFMASNPIAAGDQLQTSLAP